MNCVFILKGNLKKYFNIYEAANGRAGWQKALALHPDIIMSGKGENLLTCTLNVKKYKRASFFTGVAYIWGEILFMAIQSLSGEMLEYFDRLSDAEQKSVLHLIKTVVESHDNEFEAVTRDEY